MILNKVDDPRDTLARLTRKELEYLGRKEGRDDIMPGMPAPLMVARFRANPPRALPRPLRAALGAPRPLIIPPYDRWIVEAFAPIQPTVDQAQTVLEVNAATDLERQWNEQKRQAVKPAPAKRGANKRAELAALCKSRGIKIARTDKVADLEARLNGQDAIASCQ